MVWESFVQELTVLLLFVKNIKIELEFQNMQKIDVTNSSKCDK